MNDQYKEICERSLSSADACFGVGTHELSAFLGYHAFESLGGAFCEKKGIKYPKSHSKKLNVFTTASNSIPEGMTVMQLSVQLSSLRNLLLYPSTDAVGDTIAPKNMLTETQARKLVGRVRGLRKALKTWL